MTAAGLCSGARVLTTDAVQDGVVDDDRLGEVGSAVDDAVTDGPQWHLVEVDAVVAQARAHHLERGRVVGHAASRLTDPFDESSGPHLTRLGQEQPGTSATRTRR